jgi:hypothetical protein
MAMDVSGQMSLAQGGSGTQLDKALVIERLSPNRTAGGAFDGMSGPDMNQGMNQEHEQGRGSRTAIGHSLNIVHAPMSASCSEHRGLDLLIAHGSRPRRGAGKTVRPRQGRDAGDLLVRWLRELLAPRGDVPYLYRRFGSGPWTRPGSPPSRGKPFDPSRHTLIRGTHTLTPHDAESEARRVGARIVFDENKAPQVGAIAR